MAEFPRRVYPATQRLKELIATKLGPPRLLFCHHRSTERGSGSPDSDAQPIRVMLELIDWCRYVVGANPGSVVGLEHRDMHGAIDYRMMSLDFARSVGDRERPLAQGPLAQISYGKYLSPRWPESVTFRPPSGLQVCCEKGVAFVDLPASLVWFDEAGRHLESLDSERPVGEQMLGIFHRSVTSLVRKVSDLEDAYCSLAITQAANASIDGGMRVTIDLDGAR